MIRYERPARWITYDSLAIGQVLAETKAAVLTLQTMPYQRNWVEDLQRLELKREVAGTSRIEGADFTDRELEAVLEETPDQLLTRSQRQAYAALQTYKWLPTIANDRPITTQLLMEIHRRIVVGADDDHCPPGRLRDRDENVNFGSPRHRGVDGGPECVEALDAFTRATREEYPGHDPLIQAIAAHYHVAAMHPFLDGNGRTARALEALMLQRAGLRDSCFVAMSNYYYDEKTAYLAALAHVRAKGHDLTPFLTFALRGVGIQVRRLLAEIQREMQKALFRNTMFELFGLLKSPKKRVIAKRQLAILQLLLEADKPMTLSDIMRGTTDSYRKLSRAAAALARDLTNLIVLRAVLWIHPSEKGAPNRFRVRLEWPTEITETAFYRALSELPKAKTYRFLQSGLAQLRGAELPGAPRAEADTTQNLP